MRHASEGPVQLSAATNVAVIAACAVVSWFILSHRPSALRSSDTEAPLPSRPVSLEGAHLRGSATAPVALLEYSEFQCPFCGQFARETLKDLEATYVDSGRVLLAFRHFPLSGHDRAMPAAQAAECAGHVGSFWQMHDRLFANQHDLSQENLGRLASSLGIGPPEFATCLDTVVQDVNADVTLGRALGVTGTPTFFVGTIGVDHRVTVTDRIAGARPANEFRAVLNKLLKQKGSLP